MSEDCADCKICRFNQLYVLGHNAVLRKIPASPSRKNSDMAARVTLSNRDRVLRSITIWLFMPSIAFLLPHGILTGEVLPALGLIPVALSSAIGIAHLSGKATHRGTNIFVDLVAAILMLAMLIPCWARLAEYSWSGTGATILGTYGTVPMIALFCFHCCFFLREINWGWSPFSPAVCQHCERPIQVRNSKLKQRTVGEPKTSYQPRDTQADNLAEASFHDARDSAEYDEDCGRPSTDDETARLV